MRFASCRCAYVFLCFSEDAMGVDLEIWSLSLLDDPKVFVELPREAESEGACRFHVYQLCCSLTS